MLVIIYNRLLLKFCPKIYNVVFFFSVTAFTNILKKGNKPNEFTLIHFRETIPITYNINGWINMCRDCMAKVAIALLHDSSKLVK